MAIARPLQLLWLLGASVFIIAIFSTLHASGKVDVKDWIPKTNQEPAVQTPQASGSVKQGTERASMKDHIKTVEKIYQNMILERHKMLKDWPKTAEMPMFPATGVDSYKKTPYSIWDFFPASWSCPHEMERIGRLGDGGKWVCGFSLFEKLPKDKKCVVYSFGVQQESSYEDQTIARTPCEVWAYDFSVTDFGKQLSPEHKLRAHFLKAGIAGKTDPAHDPPFYSIQDLMKMNGHDYIDFLKIDIEYSEFDSMSSLAAAFPKNQGLDLPVGQLMVEIHLFGYKDINPESFLKWWEVLEDRGLRATWTEPNLLYTTLRIEGGDPRLAEYTFINVKDKRSVLFGGSAL